MSWSVDGWHASLPERPQIKIKSQSVVPNKENHRFEEQLCHYLSLRDLLNVSDSSKRLREYPKQTFMNDHNEKQVFLYRTRPNRNEWIEIESDKKNESLRYRILFRITGEYRYVFRKPSIRIPIFQASKTISESRKRHISTI